MWVIERIQLLVSECEGRNAKRVVGPIPRKNSNQKRNEIAFKAIIKKLRAQILNSSSEMNGMKEDSRSKEIEGRSNQRVEN